MARIRCAEHMLQGHPLSSFGAFACTSGLNLDHEAEQAGRELADAGSPVVRW